MKRNERTAFVIALILIVSGVALTSLAFSSEKDVKNEINLSTVEMVTNIHTVEDKFSNISIDTAVADVSFELAKDGVCKVVCHENKEAPHAVSVKNGTLTIIKTDEREWYEHISIGINMEGETVTVYLPQPDYEYLAVSDDTGKVEIPEIFMFQNAEIETETGDINFSAMVTGNMSAESDTGYVTLSCGNPQSLDVQSDTGDITVGMMNVDGEIYLKTDTGRAAFESVKCESLEMRSSTGDIQLERVIASGSASINTDTGDVILRGFDAEEIYIRTNTGEVSGTILSEKIFLTESDTGDIDVPKCVTGGRCEITTDTGDIKIEIA